MRKIAIIVSGMFILAACNDNEQEAGKKVKYSDHVSEGLKGDVAAIEETPYKADSTGKQGEMDSCCIDKWQYDENGNYIGYSSKDSKGTLKAEAVAQRHENGLWKGETTTRDGKTNKIETKVDDKGNWTMAESSDSTGKRDYYYTGITQTELGQVSGWKQYDKDSVFRQEWEAKYNKNLQTSYTTKDSTGKTKSSGAFKYNDKGEQTEASNTTITKDSTTTTVTKYTYDSHDEQGNWTQRTTWDDKGKATKVTKRVYTYRKSEEAKK